MSVFNGARYLGEAIDSILGQTFRDFEFIIVNDACTDGSAAIIQRYKDSRIRVLDNIKNMGLTRSLNRGLSTAQGEYVARMDADDISLPNRLESQVSYLDSHAKVGVLGTAVRLIDEFGRGVETLRFPAEHGLLRWSMCFFFNPIAHPSVMMRRDLVTLAGRYDDQLSTSQDYELWARLSGLTRLSNLPQILLHLRKHELSISSMRFHKQQEHSFRISQRLISQIMQEKVPEYRIRDIWGSVWDSERLNRKEVRRGAELIYRLCLAYSADPSLSQDEKVLVCKDAISRLESLLKGRKSLWLWMVFLHIRLLNRAIHRNRRVKVL